MSDYQLIAFDMDGTLLNGQKEISPACIHWIHQAALAGKTVILNTGRCPAELEEYFSLLPDLTYVNCVSGALVYNHATKETIYSRTLPVDIVKKLLSIASKRRRDAPSIIHTVRSSERCYPPDERLSYGNLSGHVRESHQSGG